LGFLKRLEWEEAKKKLKELWRMKYLDFIKSFPTKNLADGRFMQMNNCFKFGLSCLPLYFCFSLCLTHMRTHRKKSASVEI
jgi:hypothetical protein